MGMVEARSELRLAEEAPAETFVTRQFRRKQLQRNAAPSARLFCQIDGPHRSLAEERFHAEASHNFAGPDLGRHCLPPD
jgi:hypothetical protein